MKLLLDTSVMIEHIRGNSEVKELIENAEGINISPVSFYEVLVGIEDKSKRTTIRNVFAEFPTVPFTIHDSVRASNIHFYLSEKGKMINILDILIAAQALEHGLTVLTKDKHFDRISVGFGLPVMKISTRA